MQYYHIKHPTKSMLVAFDSEAGIIYELDQVQLYVGELLGFPVSHEPKPEIKKVVKVKTPKKEKVSGRRTTTCKNCGEQGHIRKTCPKDPVAAAYFPISNGTADPAEDSTVRIPFMGPLKLNQIKRMLGKGDPISHIAVEVGVSEEAVEEIANKLGL